ncbi:hypothetical protein NE237_023666 [Protea cynaroides]|uniref:RING-type domain-containing protein n=1 Tax=Protea cynaroides TaxID=273540 RepID=A0A9Q0HC67_9MAGN|nr:hypothetical protein NE237_023666 [Protea cynaroides]
MSISFSCGVEALISEETISESHISMTDQTSLPLTFSFNDVHFKRTRSSDVQLLHCLLTADKVFLPFDSLYSYEICTSIHRNFKEVISIIACDTFRANQAKKVRTLGFNVIIDIQTMEEDLLNTRKFEEEEIGGEVCTVCLEEFSIGFEEVLVMPCDHVFHGDWIIKWLQQSHFYLLCCFSMPIDDAN